MEPPAIPSPESLTMTDAAPLPDPARCPLCGGDNRCAMEIERATGVPQGPCWCMDQHFSADLLARLPAQTRGQACICARCVAASAASGPACAPAAGG